MSGVKQLNDDVTLELRLPPETEEWAESVLRAPDGTLGDGWKIVRGDDALTVTTTIGGNTNALYCAESFLREVAEYLDEGNIDPMSFTLVAT